MNAPKPKLRDPAEILEHDFDEDFVQGMRNRMVVSHFKYGYVEDAYPQSVDSIASLKRRIALYEETGNTEWLIDAANQAMIEFMRPRHPKAHFRATDSNESPGRVDVHGEESARTNDQHDANVAFKSLMDRVAAKRAASGA